MNINEARNRVVDMFCNLQNGYIDNLTYGGGKGDIETEADINALGEVITALDWYIDQDLIPRKDALVQTAQAVSPDGIYTKIFITLKQIPKAEYGGDNNED